MPSRNGVISILQSEDGVLRGIEPAGGAGGFVIGANIAGVAPFLTGHPFADLVKVSECWTIASGTGNYAIDIEDKVTQIDSGLVLTKWISESTIDADVPPGGEYRVRWTGTGQVSAGVAGNPNLYTAWQSPIAGVGEFTFTFPENQQLHLAVQEGTILSLECVSAVDYATYDAGQIFRQGWLDHVLTSNNRIIRILTNSNYESTTAVRTLPTSLTYGGMKNTESMLQLEAGSKSYQIPWEVACAMANTLDADLAINAPAFADRQYIRDIGQIINDNLEPHRRVFVELANETWNPGAAFYENQQRVGMANVPKVTLSLTPGGNSVSSVGHGFLEGELFRVMFSPATGAIPEFGNFWFTNQFTLRAINVTPDTFDVILDSDSSVATIPTDVTEVYAWKESDYVATSATLEDIDFNTGTKSLELWDDIKSSFTNPGRVKEIIGTQHDFLTRSLNRTGPNGTNGRYDFISLGPYFGLEHAVPAWESGDTLSDMLADGIIDVDITLVAIDDHLSAGYLPHKIFCYEGGQHYITDNITIPVGGDETALRAEAQVAFTDLNNSAEMATLYQRLHEGLADRGVWGGCTAKSLVSIWSVFGFWYATQTEDEVFNPAALLMANYGGVVAPTT